MVIKRIICSLIYKQLLRFDVLLTVKEYSSKRILCKMAWFVFSVIAKVTVFHTFNQVTGSQFTVPK